MQAEHLDVADLVFQAVGGALRLRRPDERNRSLQSEDQRCPRAAEDQIATRNLEHFYLPGLILPVAPVLPRAPTSVLPRAAQAIPQRCLVWRQPRCRRQWRRRAVLRTICNRRLAARSSRRLEARKCAGSTPRRT